MSAAVADLRLRARRLWDGLENPVLGREFRSRMRGTRSYAIIGTYTLLVMAIVMIAYWTLSSTAGGAGGVFGANQLAARVGRGIWLWGCVAQAGLLPLIVPAFTCGAITLERERDMLELLLLTRQSPLQICLGKLGSGTGLGLMLVLSSVPVLAMSLILGGIAPSEIAACLCVLVTSIIAAGAFGLAVSTIARKTVTATTAVYAVVGFGMVGVPVLMALLQRANALSQSGSELGILTMLLAMVALAFAPAAFAALGIYALRRRRTKEPPARSWWMLTTGLCWAGILLLLYLPGVTSLLLEGHLVLFLHPVVAVWGVMSSTPSGITPLLQHLWWVCSIAYLGLAFWLLLIGILRVRRLRAG
jgi:ABC-type transport system involved in multi-copper enzyme maturation permease subunit